MRLSGIAKTIAAVLFVLSLPVIFGTVSLRWLVSDVGWYRAGFEKYGVSKTTHMSPEELGRAAGPISSYLLLQQDNLDIPVKVGSEVVPLFNEREIKHMVDVRNLLRGFYNLQLIAGGYALLFLGTSWLWLRGSYWRTLGRLSRWGGGVTVGLFGVFGILSLFNFDQLFLEFHLVSFDNDLWILDPSKDRLVMMFPEGFWYDSAIRLALASGAQALLAFVVGSFLVRKPSAISRQLRGGQGSGARGR